MWFLQLCAKRAGHRSCRLEYFDGSTDGYFRKDVFHIMVIHSDTAERDGFPDGSGVIGAVVSLCLFSKTHPAGSIN